MFLMNIDRAMPSFKLKVIPALLASLASVSAQSSVLEEIVVTAQKRAQNLQDVSISVTAFSGDQMKALGVTSTQEIDNQTPGLMVTDYGGGATTVFTIRGAGQLDFNDQQEAPVAVYTDGVYNSYLAGVGFNFFDLERIEVLRGSQGTLFGRNATAGLVNIITAKPTDEFGGYAELTVGEYGKVVAEGAINGSLGDSVNGRLAIYSDNSDGYIENATGDDSHDTGNLSLRGHLDFDLSENTSLLLSARWAEDDAAAEIYQITAGITDAPGAFGEIPGQPGDGFIREVGQNGVTFENHLTFCDGLAAFNGVPNTPVLGGSDCFGNPSDNDPLKGSTDFDTYFERTHYAITATLEHEFENGVTLTSITDWQDFEKLYNEDSDSTPQTIFHYFSDVDSNQFSQELRFAGETEQSRWVAGVYYLNIDSEGRAGVEATGSLGVTMDNLWALDTTSYAVFAQYEYDFSENWTTIVGLRWTEDDKEFDSNPRCTFEPNFQGLDFDNCFIFLPQVQGTGADDDRSEGEWSGNIELNWSSEENLLVYGKISKGHKAGGYNGGVISFFDQVDLTYDAEIPITYELGLKTAFWDGKARFNGAVFYTDYEDFQTFTQRGPSLILFNIDAEVTGAELELVLNPAQGWDFLFGVSLLDGEMQDLDGAGGIQDRQMSNAPDLSYNALGRYEWSSFGGGMMAVQVDMNYVDDRVLNAIGDPGLADDSYSLWNASIEWRNDNLMVRAWVKNLTDEEYTPTSFDITGITGGTQRVASPPQWYGATVSYHF